jgi:hypothetical protein
MLNSYMSNSHKKNIRIYRRHAGVHSSVNTLVLRQRYLNNLYLQWIKTFVWRSETHVTSQDHTQLPLVRKRPHEDLISFPLVRKRRNVQCIALKVADLYLSPNVTPYLFLTWRGHVILTTTWGNEKIQSC